MRLSIFILLILTIYSCKEDNISNKRYRNENYVFFIENGKKGEWRKIDSKRKINLPKSSSTYFFPNGNKYAELQVIDSFPNRKTQFFDKDNGKIIKLIEYKSDSLIYSEYQNGYNHFYHSSLGNLQSEGLIKNNLQQGEWKFYKENNETLEKIVNFIDGEASGIQKEFWDNGNLKNFSNNYKGKKVGETNHYYDSGEIEEKSFLVDGKAHGILTEYFKNGRLKSKCKYWFGKKKDTSRFYYEKGKLKKLAIINLDTITKMYSSKIYDYFDSGELKLSFESDNTGITGIAYTYYKNGNIKQKTYLANKKAEGEFILYYENGVIQKRGFMKNGEMNGKVEHFDKKGEIIKTVIFENGFEIDSIIPK